MTTEKLVPCTNCDGEGFLTDVAGITTPCAVCEGEGEIKESDALKLPKEEPGKKGAPRPPWQC
ncbi:MAG: hypothetical protein AB1603_00700 [Chloroflexota bacterium]